MLRNVTLELSCKPFTDDSEKKMYEVAEHLFRQWQPLTDHAAEISLMLWTGDGSEILEYSGDQDDTFEWGYWQGCAEAMSPGRELTELEKRSFHFIPRKYRQDAVPRKYSWLKRMIEVMREVCQQLNGKPLRLIATFDNGPEFAISDFKYRRHREICGGSTLGSGKSVVCNSVLHGDNCKYAAYPDGIPEGTSFGSFLGSQFRIFALHMGFDALWLSNGMGFGRDTWGITGFLFNKKEFFPGEAANAGKSMLGFWHDLTTSCPGINIQTRGSNFTAGIELASDGAPLLEIYRDYKITPPVNSPWAALNFNSGLELAAWMSHIAELPGKGFPYRFYAHDPWFINSPWLDRYGREPWDIYLPLSICRINSDGKAQTPDSINILAADDSFGRMPEQVPQEVIPHLLEALRTAPDEAAPFVWIYPFRKYCRMIHGGTPQPAAILNEDLFAGEVIQSGFPLNTVATPDKLPLLPADRIIIVPVSAYGSEVEDFLQRGGKAVFYGSLHNAPAALLQRLGTVISEGISGELNTGDVPQYDTFRHGSRSTRLLCRDIFNDGPLTETAADCHVLAAAGGHILASCKGNCAFVRSILPSGKEFYETGGFDHAAPNEVFPVESLMRAVVKNWGWNIEFSAFSPESQLPRLTLSRHKNGFYFSFFCRDTTAEIRFSTPAGIPVLEEMETEISDACALWRPGKCMHKRCRIFVRQDGPGVISHKTDFAGEPDIAEKFSITGLNNAEVRIYLPPDGLNKLEVINDSSWFWFRAPRLEYSTEKSIFGPCVVLHNISGTLTAGIGK